MAPIDVLFIKPGSQKQLYGELSDFKLTAIEPPLWPALLSAYLRKQGVTVRILDAEVENLTHVETAEKTLKISPLLAAVFVSGTNPSASTMNMDGAQSIISNIHKLNPSIKTLLGGLHPSALPMNTLMEGNADFVCVGEGFNTLPELITVLKKNKRNYDIPGLVHRQYPEFSPATLLKNLDEIPMPAWDLLPMDKYRAHNWHCFNDIKNRRPYGVLFTSLGCPFDCSFCCTNALFGKNIIRYRSLEAIMSDLDYQVRQLGIQNIKIMDEMFALKEKRVIKICDSIIDRKYNLNIWAYARVDTVSRKMLSKMKQAGFNWLAYGFESADQKVLEKVQKGFAPKDIHQAIAFTRAEGIHMIGNFMFGLPGDDMTSMQQTLDLALKLKCEFVNFNCTMAYPGSALYEKALVEGLELPPSWSAYSQYGIDTFPLSTKNLKASQVLRFRDDAFQTYFSNKDYLNMIANKFGAETANYIMDMTLHKLDRRYT